MSTRNTDPCPCLAFESTNHPERCVCGHDWSQHNDACIANHSRETLDVKTALAFTAIPPPKILIDRDLLGQLLSRCSRDAHTAPDEECPLCLVGELLVKS